MSNKIPEIFNDSEHYRFIAEIARAAGSDLRGRFRSKLKISEKSDRSIVTDADLASEKVILGGIRASWTSDAVLSEEAGSVGGERGRPGQHVWIVDPLDGTTNFANGYPFFSVSIARCLIDERGSPQPVAGAVYDVMNDVLYYAEKNKGAWANHEKMAVCQPRPFANAFLVTGFYYQTGSDLDREVARFTRVAQVCPAVRRDGSAALDLALVASGIYDAFWENGLKPWDVAAGVLLVTESGGIVRNYDAISYDMNGEGIVAGTSAVVDAIATHL